MQRQKSILSFLQKPSPENERSDPSSYTDMLHRRLLSQFPPKSPKQNPSIVPQSSVPTDKNLPPEVFGTETPPEKPRRQALPLRSLPNDGAGHLPFSSIMQKFSKDDETKSLLKRNQMNSADFIYSSSTKLDDGQELQKQKVPFQHIAMDNGWTDGSCDHVRSFHFETIPDVLEPETPAMRPLVPRLKRIQEDGHNFGDKHETLILGSSKRLKLLQDSGSKSKTNGEVCKTAGSKFEWLDPSLIRDANGRRPSDALYDQRTLHIPPDALKKMSASQKQYWTTKSQYMDVVLFFKVGKFYELYELDAEIGHKELDWKITNSGVGKCRQVGISESGIDDAVQKLVARGYKVGRMEQIETSDQAKARGSTAVIQRKLVHVLTPSTIVDGNMGPDAVHLLALKEANCYLENKPNLYGFAFVDYASLKFWVGSIHDDASCSALGALLMQVSPKEVIYENKGLSAETHKAFKKYSSAGSALQLCSVQPGTAFLDASEVTELIQSKGYFMGSSDIRASVLSGIADNDLAKCALGALVDHLSRLNLYDALCNGEIFPYQIYKSCLRMDGQTLVNLEIFSNNVDGGSSGTLYKHLDNCITSSGKRLLRSWICHPLKNVGQINDRLKVVEGLIEHSEITFFIAQYLRRLPDLERLLGRVKASIGSSAVILLPIIGEKVLKQQVKAFGSLVKGLRVGVELLLKLQKEDYGIVTLSKILNVPVLTGNSGLDDVLTQIETALDDNFPHYQNHDIKDSDAETLSILIEVFVGKNSQWSQLIHALSCIDVLQSFAVTANSSRGCMCRPYFVPADSNSMIPIQGTGGPVLKIKGLWHPYAIGENGGELVPNDIYLGEGGSDCCPCTLLLTGPNMGGKSTLLRATCLAVIMAQLGCYVPCESCVLSPVDIIFTRLGAVDRIMQGESTFFIECSETASILQNATQDSLVLLDELGRGTSTFDGYAIAYAVFRHLVEKVNCRLLFATHYHPLTKEFASHPHVSLQHMACSFNAKNGSSFTGDQELVFLYKLTSGACPESYGLQVALMAGIPKWVVKAASIASQAMKRSIGENFRSGEKRSEFSTLHEEWLKTILAVSRVNNLDLDDDDFDTLLLLWHELKSYYRSLGAKE